VSEPQAVAQEVEEVVPGVWHWSISDERIGGFISAAHAASTVLIDPLPLAPEAFERLGPVSAIVLTCGSHQRSSWRLRGELGVPVWAPALSKEIDEEPDERYGDGDELPGGLRAVFTPGAGTTQHTLLLTSPSVAFVPDLLLRPAGESLAVLPDKWAHDPQQMRESLRKVLDLDFEVLCLGHGAPVTDDPKGVLRTALEDGPA
jgi:glyoxylase-like metal-dependent hydrolase (beta-lactamase superfamily II)